MRMPTEGELLEGAVELMPLEHMTVAAHGLLLAMVMVAAVAWELTRVVEHMMVAAHGVSFAV